MTKLEQLKAAIYEDHHVIFNQYRLGNNWLWTIKIDGAMFDIADEEVEDAIPDLYSEFKFEQVRRSSQYIIERARRRISS